MKFTLYSISSKTLIRAGFPIVSMKSDLQNMQKIVVVDL